MDDTRWEQHYPDLVTIDSLPPTFGFLGCGLDFGKIHDEDLERGTFQADYSLTLLGLPILRLRTYRFAKTDQGVFGIGREPLKGSAIFTNAIAVAVLLCGGIIGGWAYYINTPGYAAQKQLAEAAQAAEENRLRDAAQLYRQVLNSETQHSQQAQAELGALLGLPLQQASAQDAQDTVAMFIEMINYRELDAEQVKLEPRVLEAAQVLRQKSPEAAARMVELLVPVAQDLTTLLPLRQLLWEQAVEANPDDPATVTQLAVIYDESGELDKCKQLLEPLRDQLGDSEGARILGQIAAREGRLDEGYALLQPYVENRLERLTTATQKYEKRLDFRQNQVIGELQQGEAPQEFIQRFELANEAQREQLFQEYMSEKLDEDPQVLAARDALLELTPVVPVALDLGILVLQRGQGLPDPEERRREMEKAEQIFVSIRGFAGDTPQYRMSLGEIYYWLGREGEGKALFDQLLQESGRSAERLIQVASLLRNLGDETEARKLSEEAYQVATTDEERGSAASLRALTATELDDTVEWLKKGVASTPGIKPLLEDKLAEQAMRDGREAEAIEHFKTALRIYEGRPESDATLNNMSLIHAKLFTLTGDPEELVKRSELMERAVRMSPSEALVLSNSVDGDLAAAVGELVGEKLDLRTLRQLPDLDLLNFLFSDAQQRQAAIEAFRNHPITRRAMERLDRGQVIAPKRATNYLTSTWVLLFTEQHDELEKVLGRMEAANPDLTDYWDALRNQASGAKAEENLKAAELRIQQLTEAMESIPQQPYSATHAALVIELNEQMLIQADNGIAVDVDAMKQRARLAFEKQPSAATRSEMLSTLAFSLLQRLATQQPTLRQAIQNGRRSAGQISLLATCVSLFPEARETLRNAPEFDELVQLTEETFRVDPQQLGVQSWLLLRAADSEVAGEVQQWLVNSPNHIYTRRISRALLPPDNLRSLAFDHADAELTGDTAQAAQVEARLREILR